MTRVRGAVQSWLQGREMTAYLRQRAWHWASRGNYALAADYVIRLLNKHPRDAEALTLGAVCAKHTDQGTFYDKCIEAQRRLCFVKDVTDVCALITPSSHALEVRTWLASEAPATSLSTHKRVVCVDAARRAAADSPVEEDERVCVEESEAVAETEARVRRACASVHRVGADGAESGMVELRVPRGADDGRGLYATRRVRSRSVLLMDAPTLVQTHNRTRYCAHCLHTLTPVTEVRDTNSGNVKDAPHEESSSALKNTVHSTTVSCPHCSGEHYCSDACRRQAWEQHHACSCAARNPDYAAWCEAMWQHREAAAASTSTTEDSTRTGEELTREAETTTTAAALSCLFVAKACAMAAVQQVYPLQLCGLAHLRGMAEYHRSSALSEIGGMAVALAASLRQTHLFMEEMVLLFAVLQSNEVTVRGGVALYPVMSLLNHSCVPNCVLSTAGPAGRRQLIACRDIEQGEQLLVDYHAHAAARLSYEDRKQLCAQRGFECFCPRCVRRE